MTATGVSRLTPRVNLFFVVPLLQCFSKQSHRIISFEKYSSVSLKHLCITSWVLTQVAICRSIISVKHFYLYDETQMFFSSCNQFIFRLEWKQKKTTSPLLIYRLWWSFAPLCLRRRSWPKRMTFSCCSVPSPPGAPPTTCPGGGALGRCSPPSPDMASASTWSNTYTVNSVLLYAVHTCAASYKHAVIIWLS